MKKFFATKRQREGKRRRRPTFKVKCFNAKDITSKIARKYYQKYQVLHLRGLCDRDADVFSISDFRSLYATCPEPFDATWNVENHGSVDEDVTSSHAVLGSPSSSSSPSLPRKKNIAAAKLHPQSWYTSLILQAKEGSPTCDKLDHFREKLPIRDPDFFGEECTISQTKPIWVFIGKHTGFDGSKGSKTDHKIAESTGSQNDRLEETSLRGRTEHTDSITHTGTWHYQVSGEKLWYIRPQSDHPEWGGDAPCVAYHEARRDRRKRLRCTVSTEQTASGASDMCRDNAALDDDCIVTCRTPIAKSIGTSKQTVGRKKPNTYSTRIPRLRVRCKKGDVFVINTRLWWHQTALPMVHLEQNAVNQNPGSEYSISYARDFNCRELNTIKRLPSEGECDHGRDGLRDDCDTDAVMENREGIYAPHNLNPGDVVLTENDLPDCELPRSDQPNCEIVELDDGTGAIVAITHLCAGDWVTVAHSDSEDSDDDDDDDDDDDENDENDEDEDDDVLVY